MHFAHILAQILLLIEDFLHREGSGTGKHGLAHRAAQQTAKKISKTAAGISTRLLSRSSGRATAHHAAQDVAKTSAAGAAGAGAGRATQETAQDFSEATAAGAARPTGHPAKQAAQQIVESNRIIAARLARRNLFAFTRALDIDHAGARLTVLQHLIELCSLVVWQIGYCLFEGSLHLLGRRNPGDGLKLFDSLLFGNALAALAGLEAIDEVLRFRFLLVAGGAPAE
jgi:hypothetical protein